MEKVHKVYMHSYSSNPTEPSSSLGVNVDPNQVICEVPKTKKMHGHKYIKQILEEFIVLMANSGQMEALTNSFLISN